MELEDFEFITNSETDFEFLNTIYENRVRNLKSVSVKIEFEIY